MKIQLLKENLQQGVGMVGRFVTQKSQLPILAHIALEAQEQGVFLSGTDLEMGIRLRVGGKVLEAGEVGVPGKLLVELVQALPLGAVELSSGKQNQLEVVAGRVKAKLQGAPLGDFPKITNGGEGAVTLGEYAVKDLEAALNRTEFAISKDEGRPVLTGLLWDFGLKRLVATDGYRLSVIEGEMYGGSKDKQMPTQLIISGVFLREAVRVAAEYSLEKITLSYLAEKKQVYAAGGDLLVVGRILDGEYPKYEAILPTSFAIEARVDRTELTAAVRAAAIFAQDSAHIVKIAFEEKQLVVSANAPQVGENQVSVEAENIKPGSLVVAFNSRYVADFLGHAESERVSLLANEPLKPGVFMEVGNEGYRYVIMPVRVRGEE